jgi:hypothetical protein
MMVGAVAALVVVVLIPLQSAVFLLSPPPSTVEGFFALFQTNPLLGLVDLDLLLTLDYLVMVPFYLALTVVVFRVAPAWGSLALIVGLFSVVLFTVTREATFSMWMLSNQYVAASSATDRAELLATGRTLLTLYDGGTFSTSYILGAISTLLFSIAMVRHHVFGRLPGRCRDRVDHARPRQRRSRGTGDRHGVVDSHDRLADPAQPAPGSGSEGAAG